MFYTQHSTVLYKHNSLSSNGLSGNEARACNAIVRTCNSVKTYLTTHTRSHKAFSLYESQATLSYLATPVQ